MKHARIGTTSLRRRCIRVTARHHPTSRCECLSFHFRLGATQLPLHGCRNHSHIVSLPNACSLCQIRAKNNICPPVYVGWVCPSRLVTYRGCRPWIKSHTGHFGFPKEYHFRPMFLVPTEHPNDKSHHVRHRVTSSCYVESTYSIAIVRPCCENWEVICLKCKLPRVITRINCHVSQHDVPHIVFKVASKNTLWIKKCILWHIIK